MPAKLRGIASLCVSAPAGGAYALPAKANWRHQCGIILMAASPCSKLNMRRAKHGIISNIYEMVRKLAK